jgi:DNA polymerase
MRTALLAITEELKRLKSSGVREVSISEESLRVLRAAVKAHAASAQSASPSTHSAMVEEAPAPLTTLPTAAIERSPARELAVPTPARPKSAPVPQPEASNFPPPPKVILPEGDKQKKWQALYDQVLQDPVCREHVHPGKKIVLGVGSLDAKIFFCGEAPGAEEEEKGEPFVGPAGQLLTKMIQGMGLSRSDVYIGNIMNWRPELPVSESGIQVGNRPPTQAELAYCLPYLQAQLEIVSPDLIVALGSTATQGLLGAGSFKTLGEIRSQWKLFAGKPVMVTYHPSYILRNPTNRSKRAIWEDLLKVMERAQLSISEKQRTFFLDK